MYIPISGSYVVLPRSIPSFSNPNLATFAVFSPSHPNSAQYYSNKTVKFVWPKVAGDTFTIGFNTQPDTIPTEKYIGSNEEVLLVSPEDGVYYFHISPINKKGEVEDTIHVPVRIDTTPPAEIKLVDFPTTTKIGQSVTLRPETFDTGSGLVNGFAYAIGNGLLAPMGVSTDLVFDKKGTYDITVQAEDQAGNTRLKMVQIQVQ